MPSQPRFLSGRRPSHSGRRPTPTRIAAHSFRRFAARGILILFAVCLAGCDSDPAGIEPPDDDPDPDSDDVRLVLEVVAELGTPTALASPPGDDRLFVTEQSGAIRIVRDGEVLAEPFLDYSDRTNASGEQGLLGLAFHPDYANNGRFFINYTDLQGDTRLEELEVGSDPDRADPASAAELLFLEQPFANHNGGHLAFGPDGMLYMSTGDGGSAFDPEQNAQDVQTLHGAILRLDVSTPGEARIPPDNPFAGRPDEGREELWAWGLRNPWRFSFDEEEGLLYIADVGQSGWEEVNVAPEDAGGLNYGWPVFEGPDCIETERCDEEAFTGPAIAYPHPEGCAVIGGHVYRGEAIPALHGHYFYSDLCGGWLRSFRFADGEAGDEREWEIEIPEQVTSLGVDAAGELYALSTNGRVYRLVADDDGS